MPFTTPMLVAGSRPATIALLLAVAAACGPEPGADPAPISVTDPAGRTVSLHQPARRVVAMMPAVNEWIIAMGAADRLIARTDYDDDPALAGLPSVGGGLTPSVEWLAARRPDLVVAWPDAPSRSLVARLEALEIPVYTAPVETLAQAFRVPLDLGTLLGIEDAAARAVARVEDGLDSVRAAVADRPRPGVLFLIGLDPLMAAGPGTFLHELLTLAGGRNVLGDLDLLWPQISLEEVVRRAPDVVIVATAAVDDPAALLAGRPGWREVPAVRSGAVYALDPDRTNRPGPHVHEAAARLAGLLHPGLR
ncbi:MAG: helical backbone metal receptor [Gemmatimonadota bacterium]